MKIQSTETILVGAPTPGCGLLSNRNYFYIIIHTDEGIDGISEATVESHDESHLGILKDLEDVVAAFDHAVFHKCSDDAINVPSAFASLPVGSHLV